MVSNSLCSRLCSSLVLLLHIAIPPLPSERITHRSQASAASTAPSPPSAKIVPKAVAAGAPACVVEVELVVLAGVEEPLAEVCPVALVTVAPIELVVWFAVVVVRVDPVLVPVVVWFADIVIIELATLLTSLKSDVLLSMLAVLMLLTLRPAALITRFASRAQPLSLLVFWVAAPVAITGDGAAAQTVRTLPSLEVVARGALIPPAHSQ